MGWLGIWRRGRRDAEVRREMELHLEAEIAEGVERGMSREDARRAAMVKFGSVRRVQEQVWEGNSVMWMENLLRDARYVLRRLAKQPVFVLAVVVSLGLGVAANVSIFSVVNRLVLAPPPVGKPATLVNLKTTEQGDQCCNNFSQPVFEDVRAQARSFSGMAAFYDLLPAALSSGGAQPERVWGQTVSANFFDVAEIPMVLGRGFHADEERAPVVVLSEALWRRVFGGDPGVVGRAVMLSGRPYTVVGISPGAFHGMDQILYSEFWTPLGNQNALAQNFKGQELREMHWLNVIGRLRPGVTRAAAATELNTIAARLAAAYPKTDAKEGFVVQEVGRMQPRVLRSVLMFLGMLGAVALLVLCIACANVANLLLARAADHQREMAVRLALGSTRGRLLRQMLTESVVLALGGGLVGVALSLVELKGLASFRMPAPVPIDMRVGVDWRVLLFAFGLSVGAGMLCGMAPAWRASRPRVANGLKGESGLERAGRWYSLRNVLVVTQVSLSVVLVCATVLFLRSMQSASRMDVGFRTHGVMMMAVDPMQQGYDQARTAEFLRAMRERVVALPGVSGAAVTDMAPLSMDRYTNPVTVVGGPKGQSNPSADFYRVSAGYFEALGIGRVAGRDFGEEKPDGPKVAVINEALAEKLFGKESPLGRQIDGGDNRYEVIGVVKNTESRSIGEEKPVVYRAIAQNMDFQGQDGFSLLVHTRGESASVADAVRAQIHAMDPAMAVFNERTMEGQMREALFLPRLAGTLFGVFGIAGLLLAAVGLYGVMSYSVSRRTREIGIRLALGASRGGVQGLVVRQGMWLAGIAVVIGLPLALLAARAVGSFLYGVQTYDVVTFASVPVFLVCVAMAACWVPARRAARVQPQVALRYE